jgi:hypothetical protein
MLRNQATMKEYENLYADNKREFEECVTEKECLHKQWAEGDETVRREMVAAEGGDPDIVMRNTGGQAYNPIYVSSQDEGWTTVQTRKPIPGLVRLPTGQTTRPNPPRTPNSLPTIGGDTYASKACRKSQNPTPPACTQATTTTTTSITSAATAISEAALNSRYTTKAEIVKSTKEIFGANLCLQQTKGQLVLAYRNLVANHSLPVTTTPSPPNQNTNRNNNRNRKQATSEWNICRRLDTSNIEFIKPFKGDAYTMVRNMETGIQQTMGETKPEITILAGR